MLPPFPGSTTPQTSKLPPFPGGSSPQPVQTVPTAQPTLQPKFSPAFNTSIAPRTSDTGTLPQTTQALNDLGYTALHPVASTAPNKYGAFGTALSSIKNAGANFISKAKDVLNNKDTSLSGQYGKDLNLIAATGGLVFSPITALFTAANEVPGLNVASKLVALPFTALGESASTATKDIVNKLPISQEAKDKIEPGLSEVVALASQIYLGKYVDPIERIQELTKTFGAKDAQTIVNQAQELAVSKTDIPQPKVGPLPPFPEAPVAPKSAPGEAIVPKVGSTLYHGTSAESASKIKAAGGFTPETAKGIKDITGFDVPNDRPISLTLDKKTAELYSKVRPDGGKGELLAFSGDNLKLATEADVKKLGLDRYGDYNKFISDLKKNGYDGYHTSSPHDEKVETVVFNKEKLKLVSETNPLTQEALKYKSAEEFVKAQEEIGRSRYKVAATKMREASDIGDNTKFLEAQKEMTDANKLFRGKDTKSQLIDLYNQATKGETIKTQPETGKVAKASSDINTNITKKGFDELTPEQQAQYTPITKADQIQKVSDLIQTDYAKARDMALGKEPITGDINSQVIFNAVKNKALAEGDVATLRDLASSPIAQERSLAAQKLGASGFDNGTAEGDPVKAIQDVVKSREKAAKRKGAIDPTKTVKEIKDSIKKSVPTKETWASFVESITC